MINKAIIFCLLLGFAQFSLAHAPGLSSAELKLNNESFNARITFAIQDIEAFVPMDSDLDAELTDGEITAAKPKIAQWVIQGIQLLIDDKNVQPVSAGVVEFDDKNNAIIEFQYPKTPGKQLMVKANFLGKLPENHKQFVSIKDTGGHTLNEKMLTKSDFLMAFSFPGAGENTLTETTKSTTFTDFLLLGIEHILTGYDHLLFLFSLLIVTRSFWPAIKIITFFTIAHSITLALAGLNIVDIPAYIVEPLIALTIVYVAVENIIRGDNPKGRQWLAFFFGLVHGFGFAAVLREMGISSYETGILIPLFSFNLGVELGQISVTVIVLPIIWWLHKQPKIEPKLTPVCSSIAAVAGVYWLIERTLLG
jgi:hydrogenase/urease accessory protein HupE